MMVISISTVPLPSISTVPLPQESVDLFLANSKLLELTHALGLKSLKSILDVDDRLVLIVFFRLQAFMPSYEEHAIKVTMIRPAEGALA